MLEALAPEPKSQSAASAASPDPIAQTLEIKRSVKKRSVKKGGFKAVRQQQASPQADKSRGSKRTSRALPDLSKCDGADAPGGGGGGVLKREGAPHPPESRSRSKSRGRKVGVSYTRSSFCSLIESPLLPSCFALRYA